MIERYFYSKSRLRNYGSYKGGKKERLLLDIITAKNNEIKYLKRKLFKTVIRKALEDLKMKGKTTDAVQILLKRYVGNDPRKAEMFNEEFRKAAGGMEHNTDDRNCWCEPELVYQNAHAEVWVHKGPEDFH